MIFKLQSLHIDVWHFSLVNEPKWALPVLNEEEHVRAMQFYFERHRRRFITARSMLRFLLGQYLNRSPQSINFDYNHYGKPMIPDAFDITFNLSHSADYAVLAVGQTHDLGIDLEHFSNRDYLELAQSYFSAFEIQWLKNVPDIMKPMVFFKIWTQKEAVIKAIGAGLSYPTQSFYAQLQKDQIKPDIIGVNGSDRFIVMDSQDDSTWQLDTRMLMPGFCLSLCYRPDIQCIEYRSINPADCL